MASPLADLAPESVFGGTVAAFGHLLHRQGLPVTPDHSLRFAAAVHAAQPSTVHQLYWLARVTLVTSHEQIPAFDRVFRSAFQGQIGRAHV